MPPQPGAKTKDLQPKSKCLSAIVGMVVATTGEVFGSLKGLSQRLWWVCVWPSMLLGYTNQDYYTIPMNLRYRCRGAEVRDDKRLRA